MSKKLKEIKSKILDEVMTETELDNMMDEYGFLPVDDDDENIIKYTNRRSQIWIDIIRDDENNVLPTKVRQSTKEKGIETEVDPFHSFADLKLVLDYFYNSGKYHHWFAAMLQTLLGRRVSDICALKWSEFYLKNGEFRDRLKTLKEKKTNKTIGLKLPEYAKEVITEYCSLMEINPMEYYNEKIFFTGANAFRKALKFAVSDVGINYPVSCHSFRKFFGNQSYKLHPNDADAIKMVQYLFGHSSEEITKCYIATIDEKMDKYMEDFGDYMRMSIDGKTYEVDNSPVITFKTSDLRDIVTLIYRSGKNSKGDDDDIKNINSLLCTMENLRVR